MIGRIRIDSSVASFNLRITAAITSSIPLDNSLFDYKSISFSNKALLFFIMLNDSFLPKRLNTTGTSSSKLSDPLVIVPEKHNIALNFKDGLLNNDHLNLMKRFKASLSLRSSPIIPENHFSKKLLQVMTKDDKFLMDLITTLKTGRPWKFMDPT